MINKDMLSCDTCKIVPGKIHKTDTSNLCVKCYNTEYYKKNREKIMSTSAKNYHSNIEEGRKKRREYSSKTYEERKPYQKEYHKKNHEKRIKQMNDYYYKNKEKLNKKQYQKNKLKRETDLHFKLKNILSTRMRIAIMNHKGIKHTSSIELLGAPIDVVRKHIEEQFEPGMTWENHHIVGWHLDHRDACMDFDLTDPVQQKKCFYYKNLRPMWYYENVTRQKQFLIGAEASRKKNPSTTNFI